MSTSVLTKLDTLRLEWNLARMAYYKNPTDANEQRMDDALRALLSSDEYIKGVTA